MFKIRVKDQDGVVVQKQIASKDKDGNPVSRDDVVAELTLYASQNTAADVKKRRYHKNGDHFDAQHQSAAGTASAKRRCNSPSRPPQG